jgi:hypothetical protein
MVVRFGSFLPKLLASIASLHSHIQILLLHNSEITRNHKKIRTCLITSDFREDKIAIMGMLGIQYIPVPTKLPLALPTS